MNITWTICGDRETATLRCGTALAVLRRTGDRTIIDVYLADGSTVSTECDPGDERETVERIAAEDEPATDGADVVPVAA